jgi:hypothetical protein
MLLRSSLIHSSQPLSQVLSSLLPLESLSSSPGYFELSSGISPLKGEKVQFGHVLLGLLNVAVGLMFLLNPIEGSFILAMCMGILITIVGATCIFSSFKFKKTQRHMVENFT